MFRIKKSLTHRLADTPSTNTYLLENYQSMQEGTLIITENQTAGKGQDKARWESKPGQNLTLSLLLRPSNLEAAEQFYLNIATSLAIRAFIQSHTKKPITVKWPNDIYVNNQKIAGILINNMLYGQRIDASIVGAGININQTRFYSDAPNPVSLSQITGISYHLNTMLEELRSVMETYFNRLYERAFDELNEEYYRYMYRLNEWHDFIIHTQRIHAMITGINEFGQLRLIDHQSVTYTCDLREVSFIRES